MRVRGAAFQPMVKAIVDAVAVEDDSMVVTSVGKGKGGAKRKEDSKQSRQSGNEQKSTQNN